MYPYIELFGKEISVYNSMYGVGFVGMLLFCIFTRKKYKVGLLGAVGYSAATMFFGVMGARLMGEIYSGTMQLVSGGEYDPGSGVCLFGALMFLPVFMFVFSCVVKHSFRELMDYMTPGVFLILAFSKMGCLLGGCCHGVADPNGVVNQDLDYTVFPVQLYESICTFGVVVLLAVLLYCVKGRKIGSLYPAGMIAYGPIRFVWELFRFYAKKYDGSFFLGLTYWQYWAIIALITGIVWLVVLYKFAPEIKEKGRFKKQRLS